MSDADTKASIARDVITAQRARIVELEATLSAIHATTRRHSFDSEWFLQGVRHDPGDYVVMRVGPATKSEHPF